MATISEAILMALDLHGERRFAEAEDLYERVLRADPENPDALHLSGILLGQTGRLEEGIGRVARAVARRPASPDFHFNHGNLLRAAGRPDAAIDAYRAAHALGKREATLALSDLLRERATGRLEAGDDTGAEAAFHDALSVRPGNARLLAGLAELWFDRGAWAAAATAYRHVHALTPTTHGILHSLGRALLNEGRMAEAATLFSRARRLDPANLDSREHLAAALYHADRPEEARREAGAILALKEGEAMAGAAASAPVTDPAPRRRSRRIVSFSLWGNAPQYTVGAIENARLVSEVYPGWTCRVHHDDSVPADVLAALAEAGAELAAMEPGSGPTQGLFWRFLVADDPTVSHFLCRDADSRVNQRERAAVDAWLDSGLPFHVMRDHILHTDLMLAGMWGGRAGLLPPLAPLIREAARAGGDRVRDQRFLARHVWPLIAPRCLVHDSAHPGHGTPFPDVPIEARFAFTHVGACVKTP